ncbi:hypothetical protein N7509_006253 [Penicillium cosmopolitanum]|uniref:Agmatine deiminase n=1 Tax=Penicillium cosmopolitanum TaxID=1131564 RepID=A0A9W9W3W8_9EURO|nr:uncharacterized protein N7509_006253 [Penicillium cosmopolitanum]KAJ5398140.1 hypothetical protein N7509_006253 [Penicillium cosmopolitanum]
MSFFKSVREILRRLFTHRHENALSTQAFENKNTSIQQTKRFIFPAESEPHEATILGFPSRCSLPTENYDEVSEELADLATTIAEFEPVRMYVRTEDMAYAQTLLSMSGRDISNFTLIPCPINHCWVRDTGPVYVRDARQDFHDRRYALNFRFNEWGGKKPEHDGMCWGQEWPLMEQTTIRENEDFARWVIDHDDDPSPVSRIDAPIRLEGGALVVDGEGTLLISESSIVCDKRNPNLSKFEIEEQLKRLLSIEKVIWVPGHRNVDITDVHMDAEARFIRPGVIVFSKPHDTAVDLWKEISTEIYDILRSQTDAKGRLFEIHTIEEADPRGLVQSDHDEFVASYVNFYFVNGGLIIPKFGDEVRD